MLLYYYKFNRGLMKKQSKILLVSVGFIVIIFAVLSFLPFFPSHPFGGCKDTPTTQQVDGPVKCLNSANFWQYMSDDLKYMDK